MGELKDLVDAALQAAALDQTVDSWTFEGSAGLAVLTMRKAGGEKSCRWFRHNLSRHVPGWETFDPDAWSQSERLPWLRDCYEAGASRGLISRLLRISRIQVDREINLLLRDLDP